MYSSEIRDLENIDKGDFNYLPSTEVESSRADIPATYEDVARHSAFISEMPLEVIIEGIEKQFDDYINIEDKTNYVDIFYESLQASYNAAREDSETFQEEIITVLDEIQNKFTAKIAELFNNRLTITISSLESEDYEEDEVELIIRKLYDFFILNARKNFTIVISNDIGSRITKTDDHREYLKSIKSLMHIYSPLITVFGPMEFLRYRGEHEITELFNDGKVTGNFLRKYTPKLYQNEELEIEIINCVSMLSKIRGELSKNCKKFIDDDQNGGNQNG